MSLTEALTYAQRGWRVVPIKPGKKYPRFDEWQNVATTDTELIPVWWGRWPDHGVGIASGVDSGIFVLDVDVADGKRGDDTLADLEATYGPLPETVEVITGTGGRHLYFRHPAGVVISNNAATALGPGLDIRGEGGQVVAPPTVHPNGKRYEWDLTHDPADVAIADAPAWLLTLLTSVADRTKARRQKSDVSGNRPGDRFMRSVTWPQLLEADGAHYADTRKHRQSGTDYEVWARPGVDQRDHHGATLYFMGSDVLNVFTPNWGGVDPETGEVWRLEPGRTYDKIGYYAARHHGGDVDAALAAIRAMDEAALDDWIDTLEPTAAPVLMEANTATAITDTPPEWDAPQPLEPTPPAAYPIDVLPQWMADHCLAVAESLQVPVDLCAQIALGCWSAACAGHATVRVTNEWRTHLNLFLATAMHSGAGKSPADKAMARPLLDLEEMIAASSSEDIALAKARAARAQKELKAAENGDDERRHMLAILAVENARIPARPRLLADDVTPERLVEIMADQGGRLAIISSEAGLFDMTTGLYGGASRKTNLDIYLKGWGGEPVRVDRKGSGDRQGVELTIPQALLTVAVTVQPSALAALRNHPELAGRGFTARFMYSMPRSRLGWRDLRRGRAAENTGAGTAYRDTFTRLASSMLGWEGTELWLAPEADDAFLEWRESHETHFRTGGRLEVLAEWAAKLHGSVPRLAGLLHLAENYPVREPIGLDTMRRAMRLGDYWLDHARIVADLWALDPVMDAARKVLARIRSRGLREFTEREMFSMSRTAGFATMDEFRPVLGVLRDYGWVRLADNSGERAGTGRKPSPRYLSHPSLFGVSSARSANDSLEGGVRLTPLSIHTSTPPEPFAERAELLTSAGPASAPKTDTARPYTGYLFAPIDATTEDA